MATRLKLNAEQEAEAILRDVMKRERFGHEVRDALARRIETITRNAFKRAGVAVTITDSE